MPKLPDICDISDTQTLCIISTFSKRYPSRIVILAERQLDSQPSRLILHGFQKHRRVHETTAGLKEVARHAVKWGNQERLHLAVADAKQAFDHMTIQNVARCIE